MKEYYKINEISKLYGVGTDSLRYYEKLGIYLQDLRFQLGKTQQKGGQLFPWTWILDTFQLGNLYHWHKGQTQTCIKGSPADM